MPSPAEGSPGLLPLLIPILSFPAIESHMEDTTLPEILGLQEQLEGECGRIGLQRGKAKEAIGARLREGLD